MTDEAALNKPAVETKDGDSAILKVIEAYVNAGKASRASRKSLNVAGSCACALGGAVFHARRACNFASPTVPTYGFNVLTAAG